MHPEDRHVLFDMAIVVFHFNFPELPPSNSAMIVIRKWTGNQWGHDKRTIPCVEKPHPMVPYGPGLPTWRRNGGWKTTSHGCWAQLQVPFGYGFHTQLFFPTKGAGMLLLFVSLAGSSVGVRFGSLGTLIFGAVHEHITHILWSFKLQVISVFFFCNIFQYLHQWWDFET